MRRDAKIFNFFVFGFRLSGENKEAKRIRAESRVHQTHVAIYSATIRSQSMLFLCAISSSRGSKNEQQKIVEIVKRRQKQTHFSHSVQYNFISGTLTYSFARTQTSHEIDIICGAFLLFSSTKEYAFARTPSQIRSERARAMDSK